MPDFSKQTFRLVSAPRLQRCSCGCGQFLAKGQQVYARPQTGRGQGENRIIDLGEHYRAWLDKTAHQYALAQAMKDPKFKEYLGESRPYRRR